VVLFDSLGDLYGIDPTSGGSGSF
jgi:hypothetical protein